MKTPKEYLESVGIETFIKYFEVFEANKDFRSNQEIKEAFMLNNEPWNINSINTKAHAGKAIFVKGYVLEALIYIVDSSNIEDELKHKANKYLQLYKSKKSEIEDFENNGIVYSFSSSKIGIVARELLLWAFDQDEITSMLKLEKVETRNPSPNEIASYKCTELGSGTFLKVFCKEATDEELISGNSIRFYNTPLSLDFFQKVEEENCCYLTNQWTLDGQFYSLKKLVKKINKAVGKSKSVILRENNFYQIDVIDREYLDRLKDNNLIVETFNEDTSLKSFDPDKYKIDDKKKVKKKKLSYKDLKSKFIMRLKTQNRKYASGIYFFPVLFNRFKELDFNSYIQEQINDITIYSGQNKKLLTQYDQFSIENGALYGIWRNTETNKDIHEELHFNLPGYPGCISFKDFISDASDLSLGHIDSMYNILHDLLNQGKLKQITKLSNEMKRLDGVYKTASDLDPIQAYAEKHINMKDLKTELDLIHKKIEISIIPKRINSAMGK